MPASSCGGVNGVLVGVKESHVQSLDEPLAERSQCLGPALRAASGPRRRAGSRRQWSTDVSQNIQALLAAIAGGPPYRILDLGLRPRARSRDLPRSWARGRQARRLPEFVDMARTVSGCEVWQQDLSMTLPPTSFDGVFANAVLFHVAYQTIGRTPP